MLLKLWAKCEEFFHIQGLHWQYGNFWNYWRSKVQKPTCWCDLSCEPYWGPVEHCCEICPLWTKMQKQHLHPDEPKVS